MQTLSAFATTSPGMNSSEPHRLQRHNAPGRMRRQGAAGSPRVGLLDRPGTRHSGSGAQIGCRRWCLRRTARHRAARCAALDRRGPTRTQPRSVPRSRCSATRHHEPAGGRPGRRAARRRPVLFPGRRLVALYGHPGAPSLGVLGEQPSAAGDRPGQRLAAPYRPLSGRAPVVPAFELIATVAQAPGGPAATTPRGPVPAQALGGRGRPAGMYVVLDLQPGRANLLDQAKRYEPLLRQPHVGLALDPEWPDPGSCRSADRQRRRRRDQPDFGLAGRPDRADAPAAEAVRGPPVPAVDDRRDEPLLRTDRRRDRRARAHGRPGPASTKTATWGAVRRRPDGVPLRLEELLRRGPPDVHPEPTMARRPRPVMISYQ